MIGQVRLVDPEEFRVFDATWNHASADDKISRRMLSESKSVVLHWGNPCMGLYIGDDLVSINVTSWSKRPRKNAWGRYGNFYLAYTRPVDRQRGFATQLALHMESVAVQNGYSRLKSLAGSYLGVRLHMGMGHSFWGIGKGGALIVDTPITREVFPDGIPIEARNALDKAIKAGHVPIGRLSSEADQFTPNTPRLMDAEDIRLALKKLPFEVEIDDFALNCYTQRRR